MLKAETLTALNEHEDNCPDDIIAGLLTDSDQYRVIMRTYACFMEDQLGGLRDMLVGGYTPDPRYLFDIAAFACRAYETLAPIYEELQMQESPASNGFACLLRNLLEDGERGEG